MDLPDAVHPMHVHAGAVHAMHPSMHGGPPCNNNNDTSVCLQATTCAHKQLRPSLDSGQIRDASLS